MSYKIDTLAELEALPDGSVITWRRIVDDPSSTAVAFVNVEVEHGVSTAWISPGGWQPMSIAEAGVTCPVLVLRYGGDDPHGPAPDWPQRDWPMLEYAKLPLIGESLTGGTWAREKALECAARVWSHGFITNELVVGTASVFEAWLNRAVDQPDRSID